MILNRIIAWIADTGQPITIEIETDHPLTEEEVYAIHSNIEICEIFHEGANNG